MKNAKLRKCWRWRSLMQFLPHTPTTAGKLQNVSTAFSLMSFIVTHSLVLHKWSQHESCGSVWSLSRNNAAYYIVLRQWDCVFPPLASRALLRYLPASKCNQGSTYAFPFMSHFQSFSWIPHEVQQNIKIKTNLCGIVIVQRQLLLCCSFD